ncbi:MAG: HEAT repeat domain-containing protein, partial [Planctomycetes bacterium]|nr:HEAT repeat domain-containing protein [Planctomycetota bacterium]
MQSVAFDAVGHEIESVKRVAIEKPSQKPTDHEAASNGSTQKSHPKKLSWENTGEKLLVNFSEGIAPGKTVRIVITYRVREPKSGLYFFKPTKAEPKVPWMVWSQGEPQANRFWFPSLDHPNERQTTEIIATVDEGFEVLSNGKLVSRTKVENGKRERFHWLQSKPHVSYLVTLVAGQFTVGRDEWRGKPVTYYVTPDRAADMQRTFGRTLEMLDFFSERFGIEYPWDKYAQVVVEQFVAGGMENTSATTLYQGTMHDKRAMLDSTPDRLIAHELGHQWWGDLVTCKDWSHLWLNEGFATYCEVLWAEHKLGRDERDYLLYTKSRSARSGSAKTRPIVDRRYSSPRTMFDNRAYPKGGWVLHMLRHRLGDDDFFRALKRYGTVYAYRTAETSDLRQVFEQLTGRSLERFFYDWTERPGHPELSIATSYEPKDKLVKISIKQTQKGEPFHFPLKLELVGSSRGDDVTLEKLVMEKETTFYVPVKGRPEMIRIDPEQSVLANIKEVKSRDWWKAQLLSAPTVAERIRAVEHFGNSKNNADRELLRGVLNSDRFYGVQLEAATALGKSGGEISRDALLAGLDHQHPKVRRACAAALGKFVEDEKVIRTLSGRVKKGDESYFVEAALLDSLVKVQRKPAAEPLAAALKKDSHREVIRQAALRGLGKSPDPDALGTLLEWTKRGHPRSCRTTAMSSLATYLSRNDVSSEKRTEVLETMTLYLN